LAAVQTDSETRGRDRFLDRQRENRKGDKRIERHTERIPEQTETVLAVLI
jgi:hypothetical protein